MKRITLLLAAALLVLSAAGFGQDTANMQGTVTDKSGAAIPGAKVTVSNSDKGFTRELVSNSAGNYALQAIPIGNYIVTAEAPGFQKLVRSGITLQVGQNQRVDLELAVGQVTQEVTVTGNLPKVQTDTAAVSSVVTNTQIQNLNLNGRNWVSLATLIPGASPDNGLDAIHVGVAGNNNISFNGNRMQYSNWEIDGGNNTDEGSASTFNTYPNLDTIAEFRVSTSNYGADMGKHAGANIEMATKSGTRDFHGDAWEYVRNDVFDANDFFINRGAIGEPNAAKTPLKWNDWGYTIGGPVYIPGHYNTDKSKTFFFWSENWRRYRQGQVVGPTGVPSLLQRQGDFSQCDKNSSNYDSVVATGCVLPTLNGKTYDTVQSMPGFDAQAFANGTALLNGLVPPPNSGPVQWTLASSAPTNWRQEQIRIDQNISDKTQAFFRYTQDTWNTVSVPSLWQGASFDTIKTDFGGPGESAVLHVTHTFKPSLMNEFVAAYTTDHIILIPVAGGSSAGIDRPSNFVMNHLFSQNNTNPLLPDLSICGGVGWVSCDTPAFESAGNTPWYNSNPIITWKDNVAWVHGGHTTKFGFYLENYRKNEQFGANTQGTLTFHAGGSITTGNGLADVFLGRIQQYTEGSQAVNGAAVGGYPKGHWQMTDLEPYIQDDWKVTPRLTLNLGVRYYIYTRIHDVSRPTIDSGFLPNLFDPSKAPQLDVNAHLIPGSGQLWTSYGNGLVECGANGIPYGCQLRNTAGNIAPRFGFAWDPLGKGTTSIRGGYGIYYESGNGNEAQAEGGEGNPPSDLSPSSFNALGYSAIIANGPLGATNYTSWPYDQVWPSVQQFNLSVEHQFANNNLVSIAYVGALGRHLARAQLINQIYPGSVGNGRTLNAPALANLVGNTPANPALNAPGDVGQQLCDAAGNCNAATALIYQGGEIGGNSVGVPSVFFAPYRGYNTITDKQNTAVSSYNALQASLRHTFSKGLTLQVAYTWSHAIDDSSSTYQQTAGGIDDYYLTRWKGTGDINRFQVFQLNYVYALPFFKNSSSAFARGALGGWQVSGITSFFTGEPSDFNCGVDGYSSEIGASVRCDVVGKVAPTKGTYNDPTYGPSPQWWNPATVTQPSFNELSTNFGNMGRNILTGPGRNNWDIALQKNFNLPWFKGEHSTMQFRWETYDSFNHPQWQGINNGCNGSTGFGQPCNLNTTTPGEVNSDWGPRLMQLGLKFIF